LLPKSSPKIYCAVKERKREIFSLVTKIETPLTAVQTSSRQSQSSEKENKTGHWSTMKPGWSRKSDSKSLPIFPEVCEFFSFFQKKQ